MDENDRFPQWKTANIIIREFLKDFKPRAWFHENDLRDVQISFIDPKCFFVVPEEDRDHFADLYNTFSEWVSGELNLSSICQKLLGQPVNRSSLSYLETDVNAAMRAYEESTGISLKQCLAACLGIESALFIPQDLAERLRRAS